MTRYALGIVAVLAAFGGASITAARSVESPACPTARSLVAYYTSNVWTFDNDLVIRPGGRASLCWERRTLGPTDQLLARRSGRRDFRVPPTQMRALVFQLERIGRLGPPAPQMQLKRLVYKGKSIPTDGSPQTRAGKRALHRAEAILDHIVDRHAPS